MMQFFGKWLGSMDQHLTYRKSMKSGQIRATSHDLGPQKVAFWKGNGTPYFREI